ncbi:zinc uptake protein ZrgA [Amaricoccus tamworthensis]|uniref:zinc uptake protein ZrgA n=1 Tax=Amaricoccus tamworthensis TaxID=57002 RepID=UPI003C7A5B23
MKTISLALLASTVALPLSAQETREMDAHVHGVSKLELAVDHGELQIVLLSPGADIVGFEHEAVSVEDRETLAAAIRTLVVPENVITLPEASECRLTGVLAHLHSGAHDHGDEHEEHDHGHDDHDHDDHDHEEHAHEGDDHDHEDEHDHDEHDHEHEHEEGAVHSEFHMTYGFVCEHPEELTTIELPFFGTFENAQEIEAQFVTETGAGAAEIGRDAAVLNLN